MNNQLTHYVLKDVNFRFLNNSLRYPIYNDKYENYNFIKLYKSDCDELKNIFLALKKYLNELGRVK